MKQVQFTEQEIQALIELMDKGVRHSGLSVASNAALLLAKLQAAEDIPIDPIQVTPPKKK